jgi:hypothetical protein
MKLPVGKFSRTARDVDALMGGGDAEGEEDEQGEEDVM